MTVLRFHNVSRTYGRGHAAVRALDDATFEVAAGETVAVVGPSGSGKTTLLNLAGGLDRPNSGEVRVHDIEIDSLGESARARLRRKQVGFVFQELNLVPTLTAGENIALALALAGVPDAKRRTRIDELLEVAGLADKRDAFPETLSHGEAQRIAALRAVAHRPALVLMDEPTSSLDTPRAEALLDLLLTLNRNRDVTMIIATHDERVAARLGRVIRIADGRIAGDDASR